MNRYGHEDHIQRRIHQIFFCKGKDRKLKHVADDYVLFSLQYKVALLADLVPPKSVFITFTLASIVTYISESQLCNQNQSFPSFYKCSSHIGIGAVSFLITIAAVYVSFSIFVSYIYYSTILMHFMLLDTNLNELSYEICCIYGATKMSNWINIGWMYPSSNRNKACIFDNKSYITGFYSLYNSIINDFVLWRKKRLLLHQALCQDTAKYCQRHSTQYIHRLTLVRWW